MNDNSFVAIVSAITTVLLYIWFGAVIVFLPLAIVFLPVILGMSLLLPVVSTMSVFLFTPPSD